MFTSRFVGYNFSKRRDKSVGFLLFSSRRCRKETYACGRARCSVHEWRHLTKGSRHRDGVILTFALHWHSITEKTARRVALYKVCVYIYTFLSQSTKHLINLILLNIGSESHKPRGRFRQNPSSHPPRNTGNRRLWHGSHCI